MRARSQRARLGLDGDPRLAEIGALRLVDWRCSDAQPRELDPSLGQYVVSESGHYLLALEAERATLGGVDGMVSLVVTRGPRDHTVEHVGRSRRAGALLHLSQGDLISVHLAPADGSAAQASSEPDVSVTLTVELAMRKRKRRALDSDDEDPQRPEAAEGVGRPARARHARADAPPPPPDGEPLGRQAAAAVAAGCDDAQHARGAVPAGGRSGESEESGTAAASHAARSQAAPGTGGADAAAESPAPADGSATGSDTEWSEGFDSDDEAVERPPKDVRRLRRCAASMAVGSDRAGDGGSSQPA